MYLECSLTSKSMAKAGTSSGFPNGDRHISLLLWPSLLVKRLSFLVTPSTQACGVGVTGLNGGELGSLHLFTEVQQLSLDKCADCSVCTSAPFTTLCLTTYHLLCPGGQVDGVDRHWVKKRKPKDRCYSSAASSGQEWGFQSVEVSPPHPPSCLCFQFEQKVLQLFTVTDGWGRRGVKKYKRKM